MLTGTMKRIAAIMGLTGVALGAFGAHGLKAHLAARGFTDAWEKAVLYHLVHAVALLALSAFCSTRGNNRWLSRAAWAWTLGVLFFSGSLYALALGGPRPLVYVTPTGGIFLLAGWALLLAHRDDPTRSGTQ
jgi:uncharacterized membrane protein YgdD (TMEM256/DUF423 family)